MKLFLLINLLLSFSASAASLELLANIPNFDESQLPSENLKWGTRLRESGFNVSWGGLAPSGAIASLQVNDEVHIVLDTIDKNFTVVANRLHPAQASFPAVRQIEAEYVKEGEERGRAFFYQIGSSPWKASLRWGCKLFRMQEFSNARIAIWTDGNTMCWDNRGDG